MGQPRSYALGVLLERLHGDVVLERLDAYCDVGQSPQEKARIRRKREMRTKSKGKRRGYRQAKKAR